MSDFILNCISCDVLNPKGARFCKKCGNPLKEKTFLYYLKKYYKLILITLIVVVLGILSFPNPYIHKKEPNTPLRSNVKTHSKEKQIITAENCIDYGDGYFCSPLQKELINKYSESYKSIETECRNIASNYDHTQTVDYNDGDELTAYDIKFSGCIKKYIATKESPIKKYITAKENPIIIKEKKSEKPSKYSLSIISSPQSARIRILNIKPKYHNGIRLSRGKYHIEVSASGYQTLKQWVNLTKNNSFSFSLKKKIVSARKNTISHEPLQISSISTQERKLIEKVCGSEKRLYGPAAYYKCMEGKKRDLAGIQPPTFDGISTQERKLIEKVCGSEKRLYGPAAYYKCMEGKKRDLAGIQPPTFDGISTQERKLIEKVCGSEKRLYGPAAYYKCIEGQKREL